MQYARYYFCSARSFFRLRDTFFPHCDSFCKCDIILRDYYKLYLSSYSVYLNRASTGGLRMAFTYVTSRWVVG